MIAFPEPDTKGLEENLNRIFSHSILEKLPDKKNLVDVRYKDGALTLKFNVAELGNAGSHLITMFAGMITSAIADPVAMEYPENAVTMKSPNILEQASSYVEGRVNELSQIVREHAERKREGGKGQ